MAVNVASTTVQQSFYERLDSRTRRTIQVGLRH
jgi:hypothetical protein